MDDSNGISMKELAEALSSWRRRIDLIYLLHHLGRSGFLADLCLCQQDNNCFISFAGSAFERNQP